MSAHAMIELYVMAFEKIGALEHVENFLCVNNLHIFGKQPIPGRTVIEKCTWTVDSMITTSTGTNVHPLGYNPNPAKRMKYTWKVMEVSEAA